MIYRAEPKTLMIFNAEKGITAAISGKELLSLKNYLIEGHKSEFISRLFDLNLLSESSEEDRKDILNKIDETDSTEYILRSFTAPESIHIDVTTDCPLNCAQCYKDLAENIEMSFEKFNKVIEQAKKMGVFQIAIGGGEPLLVNGLHSFVKCVRSNGMACTVTSSGYGLTLDKLQSLKQAGINHIQISLNGSREEIHSYSRDGFAEGMRALKMLSENNMIFGINWVARMDNVYDFKNMILIARKLGADNINVLRYKPSPSEDYNKVELISEAFDFLRDLVKDNQGIEIKVDSAFSNLLCHLHGDKISPLNSGCGAGRRFMIVDVYGRLKPCSHMRSVSEDEDILKYWKNSKELLILRQGEELIGGQCKSCVHINACRGCRAICEKIYKDINAGDENCRAYFKKELI